MEKNVLWPKMIVKLEKHGKKGLKFLYKWKVAGSIICEKLVLGLDTQHYSKIKNKPGD